jgi:replicative DNA helicase
MYGRPDTAILRAEDHRDHFIHISQAYKQTLEYIDNRRTGKIKSIKTPWDKLNDATMGGIEWNTINVIAARPAAGKTLMANLITRNAFELNPDQDFAVLDYQFEMLARVSALRELSKELSKNMKELNSVHAHSKMQDEDMDAAARYFSKNMDKPIYFVEKPLTVEGFIDSVRRFVSIHKKPTLITLDHTMLMKKSASERDRLEVLYNLGDALTLLKKELPVAFLILSQLNRDIDSADRIKPGTVGNYPLTSDVFGSDAILQHADNLIALTRPAKNNIPFYGPEKFLITDPNLVAFHLLKARNGDERMSWFRAEFKHMNFVELQDHEYPIRAKTIK